MPDRMLDYADYDQVRQDILDRTLDAVRNLPPLANERYTLSVTEPHYEAKKFTKADEKSALLKNGSMAHRLVGGWLVKDTLTGKEVARTPPMTLMHVPHMTNVGTFIHNGVELSVTKQFRLRPGVYVRKTEDGQTEAHVNAAPRSGTSFRVHMDPDTAVFYLKHGGNKVPLFPVLKALGYDQDKLRQAWGNDIYASNEQQVNKPHAINWLKRFQTHAPPEPAAVERADPETGAEKEAFDFSADNLTNNLVDHFSRIRLDPSVTETTLGRQHQTVTGDTLVDTTKKILRVARNEEDPDDRDSLEFQTIHDAGDYLGERIKNDQNRVLKNLLWKVTGKGGAIDSIQPAALDKHVDHLFFNTGLAQALTEINPHDPYEQNQRVVRLGEGAIGSAELVPKEARNVSPSYFGFVDPVRSPSSMSVGVDLKLARGVRKGPDNLLYRELIDAKTGKLVFVDQRKAARSIIAAPEALSSTDRFVPAIIHSREEGYVDRKEADYILPSGDDMFSTGSNLVPMKNGIKGMRLLMGSSYAAQALPLAAREAPYVQSKGPKGSLEQEHGRRMGVVVAKGDGVVKAVYPDHIKVSYADGSVEKHELVQTRPFARQTYLRNIAQVKAGQPVRAGTVLASSNFTNDKGDLALGTNLRVAYLSYHGTNYEDASVVSESAAKKLTSEHMLQESIDREDDLKIEREHYRRLFPAKFSAQQLNTIDENGMVKPGTVLHYGDPVFLAVRSIPPSPRTMGRSQQRNAAVTWEHPFPAEVTAAVTDTAENRNAMNVYIRADLPLQEGDKVTGRHGNKGVVAAVVPDAEMPRDAHGRPFDILLSPTGVISRTNSAQMLEAQLGKIAERTGQPYMVGGFEDKDLPSWVESELKHHHLKDTETVHDPTTRRDIPEVFTGNAYFYKLQHTAESKAKARSTGAYTADEMPAKVGGSFSKHFGDMELQALLSHGSLQLIKDLKLIKGQRNDDFWRSLKLGETPIMPRVPLVYEKFKGLLNGAGIELRDGKDGEHLFAMSNERVKELTGDRRVQTADSYTEKDMQPIVGGLFDPEATGGGARGDRWSYIQLPEPMLNPIMEEPVRTILGLRRTDLQDLLAGRTSYDGKAGAEGLKHLLGRLDLGTLKKQALDTVRSGSRSKRDAAVRQYQYLSAFEREGKRPEDFIWERVPVLPPKYRPIHKMGRMNIVSDPNYMYKATLNAIEDFNDARADKLPPDEVKAARANVYNSLRALVGVAEPTQPELQEKGVGGILEQITGRGSPKGSFVQRRVIGTNADMTGLAVITPDPNLRLNQVGLPVHLAWELYEPFVVRDLVQHGWGAVDAAKATAKHEPGAFNALQRVIKERPVIYNRAPTLHKYNILGAWPVLVKGETFRIHPAVTKPFGADFDGDTMSFSVPVSKAAVDEVVARMMPERLLLGERNDQPNFTPGNEYLLGLHLASKAPNQKTVQRFPTRAAAVQAYRDGKLRVDDPIEIG